MTYYPIIATLEYKSRHLNIKLPIRATYIEVSKFYCDKKKEYGSVKDIIEWANRHDNELNKKFPNLKWISEQHTSFRSVPEILFPDKSAIFCPICYLETGERHRMINRPKGLIKVWCSTSPDYVRVEEIILDHFAGRWKEDEKHRARMRVKPTAFFDNLKEAKKHLNYFNKHSQKVKRGVEVRVKINNKITLKQLKESWIDYQKRQFIKRI